jgi:hypothetical protein
VGFVPGSNSTSQPQINTLYDCSIKRDFLGALHKPARHSKKKFCSLPWFWSSLTKETYRLETDLNKSIDITHHTVIDYFSLNIYHTQNHLQQTYMNPASPPSHPKWKSTSYEGLHNVIIPTRLLLPLVWVRTFLLEFRSHTLLNFVILLTARDQVLHRYNSECFYLVMAE